MSHCRVNWENQKGSWVGRRGENLGYSLLRLPPGVDCHRKGF